MSQGAFLIALFVITIEQNRTSSESSHDIIMDLPNLPSPPTGLNKVKSLVHKVWEYLSSFRFYKVKATWKSLNFAQRCYVGATILLLLFDLSEADTAIGLGIPVSLALLGLCYEFWPRFSRFWEHLLGKAAVLFFYAVIANFALAHSSGLVNDVTGVSADVTPYSHNFALILVLPTWFFIVSLITLVILQALLPFYLILLVILKPFGVHGVWHKPEHQYVLSTAVLRYIWLLILFINLSVMAAKVGVITSDTPLLGPSYSAASRGFFESDDDADPVIAANKEASHQALQQEIQRNTNSFFTAQKRLLAEFIFNNEADTYSRCAHPDNARVIEINDFEILTVTPVTIDEEQQRLMEEQGNIPVPYKFEVIACQSAAFNGEPLRL
ncbi:MAG: hypothetical protein HWE26_05895 [Alteromonadaceae bacterium]|nr:hypothetical protein [Alteromonadaceae bacterium]